MDGRYRLVPLSGVAGDDGEIRYPINDGVFAALALGPFRISSYSCCWCNFTPHTKLETLMKRIRCTLTATGVQEWCCLASPKTDCTSIPPIFSTTYVLATNEVDIDGAWKVTSVCIQMFDLCYSYFRDDV